MKLYKMKESITKDNLLKFYNDYKNNKLVSELKSE